MNRVNVFKDEILLEWDKIFEKKGDFYIYGAANTAKQMLDIMRCEGAESQLKGFLVTSMIENPKEVEGYPVMDVHFLWNKEINVLVPHSGVFKREIISLLESLGFKNIYPVCKFLNYVARRDVNSIDDEYMVIAKKRMALIEKNKDEEEKKQDALLLKHIKQIRKEGQPDFGTIEFYQSLERIGLPGTRPTLYRIIKYGLEKILSKEQEVLDIGCNSGFLDLTVATLVKSVEGIEYDNVLVQIAKEVKEYLGVNNISFVNDDFNMWYANRITEKKYDVIFSFAIHHWLKLAPIDYAQRLNSLLKDNGYICLESHDLVCSRDKEYDALLEIMKGRGYMVIGSDHIMDDGVTNREFVILRKPEE